ncbi:class I SAM-dependent methyltransferase [Ancrocorticia sp.]|uniref:class I SAM-dependent methyltransferase n=1 Tax=Ancrocorticia sp. TaxID=2593684 RepID=UPI003F919462
MVLAPEHSAHYTHGHERAVLASHGERTAANSACYLLPHVDPGMDLLDVGCGPGTITLDFAELLAPGNVIGIENTNAPLETARRNAAHRRDASTQFMRGDVMALAFPDHSFDIVHAHQVLQHLSDPIGALREMIRVCKPGGIVAARDADYAGMFWYPQLPELEHWRELYSHIARANGGEPDAGRQMRRWAQEAIRSRGSQADLSVPPKITVSGSTWVYAAPDTAKGWGESQAARVSGNSFTSQALALGASHSEIQGIADAWSEWGSSPDATFVIPHVEILIRV